MKCDIVRDLLPEYVKGSASQATKKVVEAHTGWCGRCSDKLEELQKKKEEDKGKPSDAEIAKGYAKKLEIQEWLLICLFLLFLGYYLYATKYRGITFFASTDYNNNGIYTVEEQEEAALVVEKAFQDDYEGCFLIGIEYDNLQSEKLCNKLSKKGKKARAIAFKAKFFVFPWAKNSRVISGTTYGDWEYVLERAAYKSWRVVK